MWKDKTTWQNMDSALVQADSMSGGIYYLWSKRKRWEAYNSAQAASQSTMISTQFEIASSMSMTTEVSCDRIMLTLHLRSYTCRHWKIHRHDRGHHSRGDRILYGDNVSNVQDGSCNPRVSTRAN